MNVLSDLRPIFPAAQYDLVSRNCNHFSELFVTRLGKTFPAWVNRAAKLGNLVRGTTDPLQEEKIRILSQQKRQAEFERKQAEKQQQEQIMKQKQQILKAEPALGTPNLVTIQVNCPNGTKTRRRFLNTDLITEVLAFVQAFDLSLEGKSFYLRANMPRKDYTQTSLSLIDAGMSSQENLFVVVS